MRRKGKLLFLVSCCAILSLSGCRRKAVETESETETEKATDIQTETESESETEKESETKKTTTKTTTSTSKTTEKTVVKPTTTTSTSSTDKTETNSTTASTTATTEDTSSYGTSQCPYCYQQISLAPNDDGTTVYSAHVAQEKAWADTYGWGDQPATNSTDTNTTPTTETPSTNSYSDVAQCAYCYQWFSVSDGTYSSHVAAEEAALGIGGGDSTMVVCPTCGNSFTKEMFSYHVCNG